MKILFVSILAMSSVGAFCQTTKPEVITISGGKGSANNVNLSWTIGELVSKTFINGNYILGNGFQQGSLAVTAIEEIKPNLVDLTVFPNPTADKMFIKQSQPSDTKMRFDLYSLDGKFISTDAITNSEQVVDMSSFSKGNYILKVYIDKELVKTYQVVKQ